MAAAIDVPISFRYKKKEKKKRPQSVERLTVEQEVPGSIPRAGPILTAFALQTAGQFRLLGNCPPTPPLIQHFALCEK